jgi:hypothetical protein
VAVCAYNLAPFDLVENARPSVSLEPPFLCRSASPRRGRTPGPPDRRGRSRRRGGSRSIRSRIRRAPVAARAYEVRLGPRSAACSRCSALARTRDDRVCSKCPDERLSYSAARTP